jgi:hypothetical protein
MRETFEIEAVLMPTVVKRRGACTPLRPMVRDA